jgi:molecular chaperone DnaJ
MSNKDLYSILGCSKQSTIEEIKISYKKLALKHHPDKNGGNDNMFKEINEAYSVLSDPDKRKQYDNPQQRHFHNMRNPFVNMTEQFFSFNFKDANHFVNTREKKNAEIVLNITLDDIFHGFSKILPVDIPNNCKCVIHCIECNGNGGIIKQISNGFFSQTIKLPCGKCKTTGYLVNNDCNICSGEGKINTTVNLKISSGPGLSNNEKIIKDINNNPYISKIITTIKLLDHSTFQRENNSLNLIYKLNINYIDSLCGKILTIPLFDEEFEFDTNEFGILLSDKQYIIPNKGLYNNDKTQRGNLIVIFTIVDIPKLTSEQRILLKDLLSNVS